MEVLRKHFPGASSRYRNMWYLFLFLIHDLMAAVQDHINCIVSQSLMGWGKVKEGALNSFFCKTGANVHLYSHECFNPPPSNLWTLIIPDRLISFREDLQWPARSPDLAPCSFFYGIIWNPWFTSIDHWHQYLTSRISFAMPLPTYRLIFCKECIQT